MVEPFERRKPEVTFVIKLYFTVLDQFHLIYLICIFFYEILVL